MNIHADKKRFWASRKRKQSLVRVMLSSLLIWLILFFALFKLERNLSDQHQTQYYQQFEENLTAFSDIKDNTDNFCRDLKLIPDTLSFLENSSLKDLERCLGQQDIRIAEDNLFISNSRAYSAYRRLLSMVTINQNYSELTLYNPKSGVSIAVTERGRYAALCGSAQDLAQFLGLKEEIQSAEDGKILMAASAEYAASRMYIVRSVGENGMLLLCGLTERTWMDSLLSEHSGKTYKTIQVCCQFPDDAWLYRREQPKLNQLGIDPKNLNPEKPIQTLGKYTILSLRAENLPFLLLIVAQKDDILEIFNEKWFLVFLLANILWLAAVADIYGFVSRGIFKPLETIIQAVPALPDSFDELKTISQAVFDYKEKIRQDEESLDLKNRQLKTSCLMQLIAGQPSITAPEHLEKPEISELLNKYVLVVLYPDDNRWVLQHGSTTEHTYRQNIMISTIRELFRRQFPDSDIEFLLYEERLLAILPVGEEIPQETIYRGVEQCIGDMEASMHKHFCFGTSGIESGKEHLSRAYRRAIVCVMLKKEQESGRTESTKINRLLKQNMNMVDLAYLGRYDEAFLCFQEIFLAIEEQKSRYLRKRQLGALLELTFCMLTEISRENTALLENLHIDIDRMAAADDLGDVLQQWKHVFDRLEASRQNKKEQKPYSKQFTKICQYMEKNFRNPNLSLSMLAEMFHLSLPALSREFHKNLGQGFLECLHYMRIEAAKFEIEHTDASLKDIAVFVGYSNVLTMTRSFKKYTGTTPGSFRKKSNTPTQ